MKKRVLSLTLCLVFLLSSFGVQAFAATTYTDLIDDILQRYESADRSAESALQQQVNGAYRCVELLYAISQELDDTGIMVRLQTRSGTALKTGITEPTALHSSLPMASIAALILQLSLHTN